MILADLGSPHFAHRLRQAAGNAVASGLLRRHPIAAVTSVPRARIRRRRRWRDRAGAIAKPGAVERRSARGLTWPVRMWIRSQEVSLKTRQDLLTERWR
jgi:hypothetical protein